MYTKTFFYKKVCSQSFWKRLRIPLFIAGGLTGCLLFAGCIPVLIGAGVVTGYAISNDSAAGNINITYRDLWDLCLDQLDVEGAEIVEAVESAGVIKARLKDINIAMKITTISRDVQRLKVSARKYVNLVPKPYAAQDIFLKITKELE